MRGGRTRISPGRSNSKKKRNKTEKRKKEVGRIGNTPGNQTNGGGKKSGQFF